MLDNFYTLRAVSRDLKSRLLGHRIGPPFSQEKRELVLPFLTSPEALVVSCRTRAMACFLQASFARARKNTADVLEQAAGAAITDIIMHPSDRAIEIRLNPAGTLVIQLFSGKENVLYTDAAGLVLNAFQNARDIAGTPFSRTGEGPPDDPAMVGQLPSRFPGEKLSRALRLMFPRLGQHLAAEAVHRAGHSLHTSVNELSTGDLAPLLPILATLFDELDHPAPRIYRTELWSTALFSIIPLFHLKGFQETPYQDLHEALRTTFTRRRTATTFLQTQRSLRSAVVSQVERAQRSIQASRSEAVGGSRAEGYERAGRTLLSRLHELPPGATELIADDCTVPLDPSVPPARTAQQLFEKAKKARVAEREAGARRTALQARIAAGERLLRLLATAESNEQIKAMMRDHPEMFDAFGLGPKSKQRTDLPFRFFVVDGGFEVWAGKNSQSNDLLTLRHARPDDLWFHARGSGGSHVVLRVGSAPGEPGKRAREQAASIAAYYSRMRKARTVPVAMTFRKYVRKPRGSPAGTVAIERETVILAQPALPPAPSRSP
jgi:predicted ribosome quality control (RQC) complex YloA/Tae2 family protein